MAKKKAKRKPAPAPKSKPKSKSKPKPRPKTKTKPKSRTAAGSATKKKAKPKAKVVKRPAPKATAAAKKKSSPARRPTARKPVSAAAKTPAPARVAPPLPPPPPAIVTVDDYIRSLPAWQAEVARAIRDIIHTAAPNSAESMKGGQPVYEEDGPICYFKSFSDHVTFGFWRGMEMPDPSRLLKGEGDRMRHVRLTMFDDVPRDALEEFVRNAVRLNREKGNPTLGR